ncbi:MAG TPA: galactokinase [Rhodocyclaceae bacterium]|nr:galactokinase [Rhodocyclaceae bacterium]
MADKSFQEVFGQAPEVVASAPGRVNLLGEHTDYNDGYVLPIAITQSTTVSLRRRQAEGFALYADSFGRRLEFTLSRPPTEHFAQYVYGCLVEAGVPVPPLEIHVHSEVPMGVGLSSSAALEVATLRALRQLLGLNLDDIRIAQLAQAAEVKHAGVACGIMDQMASSLCDTTHALFLDTRSLESRLVSLPPDSAVLVLDSGVSRSLAKSGYNDRRAECEAAARLLGVPALRDVADPTAVEALPEPIRRRARHVVSENARVLEALDCADAAAFGRLMNASHASLRDDYEVSVPELDILVGLLQAQPAVYGARLTGAGFGGACVALCRPDGLAEAAAAVLDAYARQGFSGQRLVP